MAADGEPSNSVIGVFGVAGVSEQMQGFLLTRHWRDTAAGTEVDFWLATDEGPRHVRLAPQPSVGFIPAEQLNAIVRTPTSRFLLPPNVRVWPTDDRFDQFFLCQLSANKQTHQMTPVARVARMWQFMRIAFEYAGPTFF
jgi:hypothetical protein